MSAVTARPRVWQRFHDQQFERLVEAPRTSLDVPADRAHCLIESDPASDVSTKDRPAVGGASAQLQGWAPDAVLGGSS